MNSSYHPKKLTSPLQTLIRPMLLTFLALHGLLFLMPMSEENLNLLLKLGLPVRKAIYDLPSKLLRL
jgi:hypothetical protein